eukprot:2334706-Rhodomonas_salina.1
MHDDERPVGVGADAMDVLLDVDRLLEGLERLLDSAQLQQRDAHLVDRARDHGVQVAEMLESDAAHVSARARERSETEQHGS